MAATKIALGIVLGGALLIPAATVSTQAGHAGSASATTSSGAGTGGKVVAGEAAQASGTRRVVLDCEHKPRVRPASYVLACGDGNNYLASMKWSTWAAGEARGSGYDVANDCRPYCAAGHFHRYAVTVALTRPRPWAGHSGVERFTRVVLVYQAGRPEGAARQEVYPLP